MAWARVHKIDRIRPQSDGSVIVLVEDERNPLAMGRVPGLSTVVAIARILNARRVLEAKYAGKGEVRYAAGGSPPSFLLEAIVRAGASVANSTGERVLVPGAPAGIVSVVDTAFADLAHHVRTRLDAPTVSDALDTALAQRRTAPLDRDANPAAYWTAVFEIAALVGELSRPRGGRWIETKDMPVPFAIQVASGALATPAKLAMRIVEGASDESSAASA